MNICPTCKAMILGPYHKCPPQWVAWDEECEPVYEVETPRSWVRGSDFEEAVKEFASRKDEAPDEFSVWVIPLEQADEVLADFDLTDESERKQGNEALIAAATKTNVETEIVLNWHVRKAND